jgi:hypothetical protein
MSTNDSEGHPLPTAEGGDALAGSHSTRPGGVHGDGADDAPDPAELDRRDLMKSAKRKAPGPKKPPTTTRPTVPPPDAPPPSDPA